MDNDIDESGKLEPGVSGQLRWSKEGKTAACTFTCEEIFSEFVDEEGCVSDNGMKRIGEIDTDCGKASYVASKI